MKYCNHIGDMVKIYVVETCRRLAMKGFSEAQYMGIRHQVVLQGRDCVCMFSI